MTGISKRLSCAVGLLLLQLPMSIIGAQSVGEAHMNLDRVVRTFVLAEQLEIHGNAPERPLELEVISWIGGDYRRLFVRQQG